MNLINLMKYSSVGKFVRSQWIEANDIAKDTTLFGYALIAILTLALNAITLVFWFFVYVWLIVLTSVSAILFTLGFSVYVLSVKDRTSTYIKSIANMIDIMWNDFRPDDPKLWVGRDK